MGIMSVNDKILIKSFRKEKRMGLKLLNAFSSKELDSVLIVLVTG